MELIGEDDSIRFLILQFAIGKLTSKQIKCTVMVHASSLSQDWNPIKSISSFTVGLLTFVDLHIVFFRTVGNLIH
jgi:hypothetical protein